jgi:hypothetical protein
MLQNYNIRRQFRKISNRDEGKLKILVKKEIEKKGRDYLILFDDLAKGLAKWAAKYSNHDSDDYIFGYFERQLDSILVPIFWDIVDPKNGVVMTQHPTKRKSKYYTKPGKSKLKLRSGWIDYRLRSDNKVFVVEIKLASSNEHLDTKNKTLGNNDIYVKWRSAKYQLANCSKKSINDLGRGGTKLFKTSILFIPIYVKMKSSDKESKKYDKSCIETQLFYHLDKLIQRIKKQTPPDWIAYWSVPDFLSAEWQDDEDDNIFWKTPGVLVFAKTYEKWNKSKTGWYKL